MITTRINEPDHYDLQVISLIFFCPHPQKSLLHNAHYHKCVRLLVHAHVCTQVHMDKKVCTQSLRTKQNLNNPAITVLTIIAKNL